MPSPVIIEVILDAFPLQNSLFPAIYHAEDLSDKIVPPLIWYNRGYARCIFPLQNGLFPAIYHAEDLSDKSVRGVSPLDSNHTHFILVDDGSEGKFGREIDLRTSLERGISQKAALKTSKDTEESKCSLEENGWIVELNYTATDCSKKYQWIS